MKGRLIFIISCFRPLAILKMPLPVFFISCFLCRFCYGQTITAPALPVTHLDSSFKKPFQHAAGIVSGKLQPFQNPDSLLEAKFDAAASGIINKIKEGINSSLGAIRKNRLALPKMPKIDNGILKSLSKPAVSDIVVSSEASEWQTAGSKNVYWQNDLSGNITAAGIPVRLESMLTYDFFKGGQDHRLTYHLNYNKNAFLEKLGLNTNRLKDQMRSQLDFAQRINYKEIINKTFSEMGDINGIMKTTGCNWDHLLEMPMEEFKKTYNKDVLKSQIADAEKLKKYYADYVKKSKDSLVAAKLQVADSQVTKLKQESELYEKLIRLKQRADKMAQKIQELKKMYEEKVKVLMEGYNAVNDVIKNNKDLTGIQKFMLKVKGLNIGQHVLSTGNLALKNYLQNGISFEYETDRAYLLLTKGSQDNMQYPGLFFQNTTSTQPGINEYYQFNSRYKLTGISLAFGNRARNYQQVSLMSFNKVDNTNTPSLVGKTVNVVTIGKQLVSEGGLKLSVDISKSMVKQANTFSSSGLDRAPENDLLESVAVQVKFESVNRLTQENQKLSFFYSTPAYNNPGLNGGISRPGIQLNHGFVKKINQRLKAGNQLAWYSFKYGNSMSFRTVRDRLALTYKIRKMRVGLTINGDYGNQLQYNPKVIYRSNSLDILATGQGHKRLGMFFITMNGGLGYGYSRQESFNKIKSWSYYSNTSISYRGFSLNADIDKFNTKNTEVFLFDSTALLLVSSFNLRGGISYSSKKGNMVEAIIQYKVLNNNARQFFIGANAEWNILNRILLTGSLNLPIASPATVLYVNNTFNAKVIYNIKSHAK